MAEEIVITALEKALELVRSYIEKAQKEKLEDIERCRNYLRAVQEAIKGLEREYDEILTQAEYCDLNQSEQVLNLQKRITNYLTVDNLKTELDRVSAGLEESEVAFRKIADSKLQFWWKKDRETALVMFNYLLERLTDYLKELEDSGLQWRKSWTGVGIKWLKPIKELIDNLDPQQKDNKSKLTSLVTQARKDRSKDNLIYYTRNIERISNILLLAFR